MKAGIKTTEFWATVLILVGTFISSSSGALPAKWAAIADAITAGLYAVSRGLTKHGAAAAVINAPSPASK